jgi:hypothetical protein
LVKIHVLNESKTPPQYFAQKTPFFTQQNGFFMKIVIFARLKRAVGAGYELKQCLSHSTTTATNVYPPQY